MRTVGIIVEYNPLHNGHAYHYEQSMKAAGAEACIAVMSGQFLQRGEPALVNKWARTEMALRMGADLVIELPVAYACQPAEWFAYGAVKLLHATGIADAVCFGSEDGQLGPLQLLADQLYQEDDTFRRHLQEGLKSGQNYPAAYAAAVAAAAAGDGNRIDLEQPNNILGLHYLIALKRLRSSIIPLTISRQKAAYHQLVPTDSTIASATAIRRLLFEPSEAGADPQWPDSCLQRIAPYVPSYTLEILEREFAAGRGPLNWECYAVPLFSQLLAQPEEQLARISEVSEGLEHRIKRALQGMQPAEGLSVTALLQLLKTRRYTHAKLQRMLLRILLQHPKQELTREILSEGPSCIRVLGFSAKGQALLKQMKKTAALPVTTQVNKSNAASLLMDIRATSVYSLGYKNQSREQWLRDYYQPPLRLSASE
ncbi:MAG: nucleotidyltransferase [Paenibacillaceae bacterium]|nr:nucleotidyltransferase [Paenibacillaceae bacterium]